MLALVDNARGEMLQFGFAVEDLRAEIVAYRAQFNGPGEEVPERFYIASPDDFVTAALDELSAQLRHLEAWLQAQFVAGS